MADKRQRYIVEIAPDVASTERTKAAVKGVQAEFAALSRRNEFTQIALQAAQFVDETGKTRTAILRMRGELEKFGASKAEIAAVTAQFERFRDATAQASKETAQVAVQVRRVAEEQSRSGGGRVDLRSIGRSARVNLPAVPLGGFSSEQLARLVEGLGLAGNAFEAAGAKAKLTGVAVAAFTVAIAALFVDLKKRNDEAKRLATEALTGVDVYFRAVNTKTQEQIKDELESARLQQRAAEQALAAQQSILDGLEANIDAGGVFNRVTAEAGALTNGLIGQQPELVATREAVENARKALTDANAQVDGLTIALNSDEVAAKAAAEATRELVEARQKERDELILSRLGLRNQFEDQTPDSIEKAIDARRREAALVLETLGNSNLSADAIDGLNKRLAELLDEVVTLEAQVLPAARAAAEAAAALEDEARQRNEAISATRKFNDAVKDLAQQTADNRLKIENDYADKVVKLTDDYARSVEAANRKLAERVSDIAAKAQQDTEAATAKAQQARLEQQLKFNLDTEKQVRDLQRNLRKIREDSAAQESEFIRNRDFAGLQRLRADRNRALDGAVDAFNVEQREREIAFRAQQEQTNRQLEFEAETRRIRFEQQIADARAGAARERQELERKRREQEALLAQSRDRELRIVADTQNNKLRLLGQAYNAELQLAAQTAQQRLAIQRQTDAALLAQARLFAGAFNAFGGGGNSAQFTNSFNISTGQSALQTVGTGVAIAQEIQRQIRQIFG